MQKYDRYGRTLAYVYLEDSTFLNAHLLEMGLARLATYPPNVRYVEDFTKVQEKARVNGKGLWND
ncbi:thermonuclease family protein [Algoriphagus sp. AGSA1]|uniref:thermonuclease family protein n=1 Tax=unclassified Algoriphagus TaxID=2641541 RepID=UPI0017836C7C|nr:thermonuclease family protein [Algoriphagus sp. Y33]MCE7057573.1 thermonuclease family protein [Algoriphagus sp. AGSA1]